MKINAENNEQSGRLAEPEKSQKTGDARSKERARGKPGEGFKAAMTRQKKRAEIPNRAFFRSAELSDGFGKALRRGRVQRDKAAHQSERIEAARGQAAVQELDESARRQTRDRAAHFERDDARDIASRDAREELETERAARITSPTLKVKTASGSAGGAARDIFGQVEGSAEVLSGANKMAKAPEGLSERQAEVAKLAREIIDQAHLGHDRSGRQIMLLDLKLPGRGNIRVRLRRRGDSFEVRMRPESPALARLLRQEREVLRERAAESGVNFSSIEVV